MDYQYGDIIFEWDDNKNEINKKIHGIDFKQAAHIFEDQKRIEFYDVSHSVDEERYVTIGYVHGVLYVVYTERKSRLRLISARIATREEEELYYGNGDICIE